MHHPLLICAILCATVFCVSLAGVPLNNFFKFGKEHGDKETVIGTDPDRVDLEPPFRIFGKERDYVYVYCNGGIALFGGGIMPFAFDYYPSYYMGNTFYRQSNEKVDLDKARREIGSAFPAFQDIDLKWVVIGTWKQIGNTQHPNALNTFQAILTTDGVRSFVIFNYNETNKIVEGTLAKFDVLIKILNSTTFGYNRYEYLLEGSNTSEMLTINHRSNVNIPGKWIFRIDLPKIYEPSSMCPKPPQPVNGFCKVDEYTPDSEARCGCNLGFSPTSLDTLSLKCLLVTNSTYNWVGNIPVCRTLSQGDSQISIPTQITTNSSTNVSAPSHSTDICSKVTCPPPPVPENAICEEKAYVPGSAASCTCLPNHHLKNPDSGIHCVFDKDGSLFWHGEVPVCLEFMHNCVCNSCVCNDP
ncbi:nidogen-like domain-containing protein [Ditylenchus destructor]|nr:nidogen-like domain-containing protein [Ditylenchus destructor]